jgi:outer membrane protein assembly factor BamB
MVVVAAGDGSLYVLAGATGRLLYENDLGSGIYAPPAIADGSLLIGTTDGAVHAFRFP